VSAPRREPWRWYALLLVPFVAYLFFWIAATAALNGLVYLAIRGRPGA
jgi:hypothetical protein